jgi:hypothetical protein
MFFAAEKERTVQKKRQSQAVSDHITVDSRMEIHLGALPRSRLPGREALTTVYPDFSAATVKDIIQIADPEVKFEAEPPLKRHRITSALPVPRGDIPALQSPVSVRDSPQQTRRYDSLDDLIRTFPDLERIIAEQKSKLESTRIPLEYVKPYKKPLLESKPLIPSNKSDAVQITKPSDAQSMSTSTPPDLTSAAPTPAEPATGAGLLSGIDDLFGGSKRSKLKPKSRR